MQNSLLDAIKFLLREPWRFFTETTVPGTSFTYAALHIGIFLIGFGLRFLGWVLRSRIDTGEMTQNVSLPPLPSKSLPAARGIVKRR